MSRHPSALRPLLLGTFLASLVVSPVRAYTPSDPNLIQPGRDVLNWLEAGGTRTANKVLSGQWFGFQNEGHTSVYAAMVGGLHDETGRYVGIAKATIDHPGAGVIGPGISTGGVFYPSWEQAYPMLYNQWQLGGVPAVSLGLPNPWTGGSSRDLAGIVADNKLYTAGTTENTWLHAVLDHYAVGLQKFETANIPVILSVFHEDNTFRWYNPSHLTAVHARNLHRHIVDYLRGTKGLKNLIIEKTFDSGAHSASSYPGNSYVDLVGWSGYLDANSSARSAFRNDGNYETIQAIAPGRILGLSETGMKVMSADTWDSRNVIKGIRDHFPAVRYAAFWQSVSGIYFAPVDQNFNVGLMNDGWIADASETPFGGTAAALPAYNGTPGETNQPAPAWNFNTGDEQGWFGSGATRGFLASNRNELSVMFCSMSQTGNVHSPAGLGVNAANNNYISIRLKNLTRCTGFRIMWKRTTDSGLDSSRQVTVPISDNRGDAAYQLMKVRLDTQPNWNGTIDQVVFLTDGQPYYGGWGIDYVRFTAN